VRAVGRRVEGGVDRGGGTLIREEVTPGLARIESQLATLPQLREDAVEAVRRVQTQLDADRGAAEGRIEELDLVLNSMIRDLFRLLQQGELVEQVLKQVLPPADVAPDRGTEEEDPAE